MQELLLAVARGLVEDKEAVQVTVDPMREDGTVVYHLKVAEADMGRVIGRHPQHLVQRIFNGALHRTQIGLFGPAIESAAVVGQVNAQSCHSHSL